MLNPSDYALRYRKPGGPIETLFEPLEGPQVEFLAAQEPNLFFWGNRGGGKSFAARMLCHGKALAHDGLIYIVVRRSFPELNKNHLIYLHDEMDIFGGKYNKTEHQCYYPNGSVGFYAQCSSAEDVKKIVGAEAALIIFDEAPELEWDWIRLIAASVRVKKNSGLTPMMRYLGNPIGPSIDKLFEYCIEKTVNPLEDPEYNPADWRAIEIRLEQNTYIDTETYRKQFAGIPDHIKRAWLEGIRVVEGAYFIINPARHYTTDYPNINGCFLYRAVDWGTHDAAVCLWIAVYPSGRAIVFKERSWTHTTAKDVALEIKAESQGMRITESYCDPTMFPPEGSDLQFAGNIFEANGISLTKSRNDRTAAGFAITEWLNTPLEDGLPRLQIYAPRCPKLAKTLPEMRMDPKNPGRILDGNDHWVMALAYFTMAQSAAPRIASPYNRDFGIGGWSRGVLRPTFGTRPRLGSESIRRR